MNEPEMTPDIFTADYVGRPGQRSFYLQARGAFGTRSFEVEKAQVAALADKLREILVTVDPEDTVMRAEAGRDPALQLESPVESDYRVGTLGLAYEDVTDRIVVLMQPVGAEDEVTPIERGGGQRLNLRRDQVRAFVLHASAIVSEGRPICQLCGLPKDPDGHLCPASNGHHPADSPELG
jgi:uncharacterized repeat protein (TIGR03847 family)